MAETTIAIVGAGFSGTLLSLHLLRRCPPATRVVLIERQPAVRPGHGLFRPQSEPSAERAGRADERLSRRAEPFPRTG